MTKRTKWADVVLSKSLVSLTLDFLGFQEVCKSCRLVCSSWAYENDLRHVEWNMDTCPYAVLCNTVNLASVRVLKVFGSLLDHEEQQQLFNKLQSFTSLRVLYLARGQLFDLQDTLVTHLFVEIGKVISYPVDLEYLHALRPVKDVDFLVQTLPNLTTVEGVKFALTDIHDYNAIIARLKHVCVYGDCTSAAELRAASILPKTMRISMGASDAKSLLHLTSFFSTNLYFSLAELEIPTSCTVEQWVALATLPNLTSLDFISQRTRRPTAQMISTKYLWPSLERVCFNAETNLNFLALFVDAKKFTKLKIYEDVVLNSHVAQVILPQVQHITVMWTRLNLFGYLRGLVNLRSVFGICIGTDNFLKKLTLPLSVRVLDLDVPGTLVADTIHGFLSRHFLTSVTLRAYELTYESLSSVEKIRRPLNGLKMCTTMADDLLSVLSKKATILPKGSYCPVDSVEEAFDDFVKNNPKLINAL